MADIERALITDPSAHPSALDQATDLDSHHIEGYATAAMDQGKEAYFKVPLISEVLPGLWQGGCKGGVQLPEDFNLVVSLYPWEKYALGPLTHRVEIRAYDSAEIPDFDEAAKMAHETWKSGGKVLIHCQAGLNRSGLLTSKVLMLEGYSAQEAIDLVRAKRCPLVLCNKAFETHLLEA